MPSRSSDAENDDFDTAFDAALALVRDAVRALSGPHPRILIDGRSGSGKSTLAERLRDAWPRDDGAVRVIALDELYPGWDGLAAGSEIVREGILDPLSRGAEGAYHRWDWAAGEPGERVRVAPDRALIVEGAGALTSAARELVDLAIWIDAPERSRKRRALDRDGDGYAPHWERWAAQERAHIAAHAPASLADLTFDLP